MDELDLRAFDDAVAEAAEDVLDLAPRGAEQMVVACGFKRRAGQRDVNVVFGKCGAHLSRLKAGSSGLDHRLERLARFVRRPAGFAALLGWELRHVAQ